MKNKCNECGANKCPSCEPCCACKGTGWVTIGYKHKHNEGHNPPMSGHWE